MSAAALALEPVSDHLGIWRRALLLLAGLHAAAGFLAIGGALAYAQVAKAVATAVAAAGATVVATFVAFRLAAHKLGLSQSAATSIASNPGCRLHQ